MVLHGIRRCVTAANVAGLRHSMLLLFLAGSKAYRDRTDFYRHHEAALLLEDAPTRGHSTTDDQPHLQNMEVKIDELGSHAHTQLGTALDVLNNEIGGMIPWSGDDMARTLVTTGFLVLLGCILGSICCICRSTGSSNKRPNRDKSEPSSSHRTEDEEFEPGGKSDMAFAAELEAIAQRLPSEVRKCPKHWTTSLFKGLLDRYIAIVPSPASDSDSEALRWRRAQLTMWGSKDEYRDGVTPKGSMPVLQISEVRIVHEIPSIWMSSGSKAIVMSHKHNPDDELTLILERKSAELFYATLRQYLDKLEMVGAKCSY